MERHGMGFSVEQRQYARDRAGMGLVTGELAGGKCEFPGDECFNKPDPKVSHLEGVFVAFLDRREKEPVRDIRQNSLLQCPLHNAYLDAQESFQVQSLLAERHRGGTIFDRRINRNTRTQRRRK